MPERFPQTSASEPRPKGTPPHLFSVDVEEHFQVSAFESVVPRATWDCQPSRVERNTEILLQSLERFGVKGTFFVLGWVAQRCPGLVRRIAAAGHELGSHGWWHYRVTTLSAATFRDEVRDSKATLEDLSGTAVQGFRAPSFSIVPGFEWAFDVLLEQGYTYDSSLFPVRRPGYGYPASPGAPHRIQRDGGSLLELPLATAKLASFRI